MTRVIASFALLGCFWGLVACSTLDQDIDPAARSSPPMGLQAACYRSLLGSFPGFQGLRKALSSKTYALLSEYF